MLDIPATLLSLTRGMEMLKAIRDIDKSYDAASYKANIAELMGSVADAKMAMLEAKEEIAELKAQIEKLRGDVAFKTDQTVRFGSFVFQKFDGGKIADFPFCPKCLNEGKFFPLLRTTKSVHECACPNCKTSLAIRAVGRYYQPGGREADASQSSTPQEGAPDEPPQISQ